IVLCIFASDIIVPICFSVIFAVVMSPAVKFLERKLPSTLAITLMLIVTLAILVLLIWLIVSQITSLVADLPDLQTKFDAMEQNVNRILYKYFGFNKSERTQFFKSGITNLSGYATNLLASTTTLISLIIQVPIYIFLFLIYRDRFKAFFENLLPSREEFTWKKEVEGVIQGYISGLLLVTLIVATLNTIGLFALGINHAIFFGILSGVLTIIPYVGIFIGATLPVLMALITKDSIWYAGGVIAIFSTVQFLEGNFITPRITGSKVSINALAAIVALLIGGKILGIAGMILAIPALGVLKILLSQTKYLKHFVILIEDTAVVKKVESAEIEKEVEAEKSEEN
ncbi:MAG TPA: AI-2E family transporter, partial [Chryseolinea sp.]|nr:AI-2E family transporter [Chryseolinea sp.]